MINERFRRWTKVSRSIKKCNFKHKLTLSLQRYLFTYNTKLSAITNKKYQLYINEKK